MAELSIYLKTPPEIQPISLAEAKIHSRVDPDITDDDALIRSYIKAATDNAQAITRRQFINGTYELRLNAFPPVIKLPRPPLWEITSIKYFDTDNVEQTLDSSKYMVDEYSTIGQVLPAPDESWPGVGDQIPTITIEYIAGYGDDRESVPDDIKSAIKLIVGHLYEHRETVLVGVSGSVIPQGAADLLYPHRIIGEL